MKTNKIVLVSVIIDNKILMINRSKIGYKWDLPGGNIGNGEKITETATVYFEKKTGYKLKITGINKIYNCQTKNHNGLTIFNFAGKLEGGKIKSHNHNLRWISVDEIINMSDDKLKNHHLIKKIIKDNADFKPVPISIIEELILPSKIRYDNINLMPKFLNNGNFPIKLFIAVSVTAFTLLFLLFVALNIKLSINHQAASAHNKDKYYLNKKYQDGDGLVTKVPALKDILAGPIISNEDPVFGNPESNITIIEFSDFECKFCQKQEKILREAAIKNNIKLIWKDAPSSKIDSSSYQASLAGRCADKQGSFWQYHDELFDGVGKFTHDDFINIAKRLKLNTDKFTTCLDNAETKSLVDNNIKEANALNIKGIPFVYINDQEIMGQTSAEEIDRIIKLQVK